MEQDLKVLIVSSEAVPYAKSGGLGDVIGSLPQALKKIGVDVRVVIPKYNSIKNELLQDLTYINATTIQLGWRSQSASIFQNASEVPTYLIENDYYFGRYHLYGFWDDNERFAFFSKAVIEMLDLIDFKPDIIHCNDWQTGPISLFLKEKYGKLCYFSNVKTVFTIHNMQYQGVFGKETLNLLDLSEQNYNAGNLEFYNNISYMKAGLTYSDVVTTVSETYAKEIQTGEYGYGLDGVVRSRSNDLYGILNGLDYQLNNPETDHRMYENFGINNIWVKKNNKIQLQRELNLPQRDVPMFSIVSRLVDQKGLDLIERAFGLLMEKDIQIVILGTGDGRYEHMFHQMAAQHSEKVSINTRFDDTLAQKIYSSSDLFFMPSRFEPCGLGQIIAMRYGTIPVVRKTGGLADTVVQYNPDNRTGTGFIFENYDVGGLMWAVNYALAVYERGQQNGEWNQLVQNALSVDFSWNKSAEKYVELYLKIKNNG